MPQSGVLDNQNRVLGGEADERHDANLCIHVVRIFAEEYACERTEHTQRYRQNDGKWNGPTLVLSRQEQEHQYRGEREDETFLAFGQLLLKNRSGPLETKSRWQVLARDPFHCRRGL